MYNATTDLVAYEDITMEGGVNIYLRKRPRSSSGTLLVTFLFGFAIGFFVAFAFLGGSSAPVAIPAVPPVATTTPQPQPAEKAPQQEPAPEPQVAAAEPPAPSPAEFWPGRFLIIAAPDTVDDAATGFLAEIRPGAVLLRDGHMRDPKRAADLIAAIKDAAGFGRALSDLPLIAVEQEGGRLNPLRLKSAPSAAELAASADTEAARIAGQNTADAALTKGIGVVLAPVLAVIPKGVKNDAMYGRIFGSDQEVVANMGLAFADGISLGGAISVAKYYPGVGIAKNQGSGLQVLDAESPKLAELMYPFWEAATAGLPGILASHVAVPSLDLAQPDRPASMSPVLISRILRKDWKYSGVILADDVCSKELAATTTPGEAAVDALAAGCDAVLALDSSPDIIRAVCTAIQEAVDGGAISKDALTESRGRLESWQAQLAGYTIPLDQPSVELAEEKDIPAEPAPVPGGASQEIPAAPVSVEPAPEPTPAPAEPAPTPAEPAPAPAPAEPAPAPVEPAPAPAEPAPIPAEPAPAPAPAEPAPVPIEPASTTAEQAATVTEPSVPVPADEPVTPAAPEPPAIAPAEPAPTPAPEPPKSAPSDTAPAAAPSPDEPVELIHVIQPGEMLSAIAAQYGVKQSDIVRWNDLKTTHIKYGFKLKIYRPASAPPLPPEPDTKPAPESPPAPAGQAAADQGPTADEAGVAGRPVPSPEQPAEQIPPDTQAPDAEPAQPEGSQELLANRRKYVVQAGDTLATIGQNLGIDPKLLMAWNGLENEDVSEGQVLVIFASGAAAPSNAVDQEGFYTVSEGDNAYRIAQKFNTDVKTLLEMNKDVKDPDLLVVGQRIAVPKKP